MDWPDFRGPTRDGRAPWLPTKLPATANFLWTVDLPSEGVGGIAVAANRLIVGCRDPLDQQDVWLCLDATTGEERWRLAYDAPGALDYGNAPRATPVIRGDRAWLAGALGHLHCLNVETGETVWKRNLAEEFSVEPRTWGHAGTPLLHDMMLIAQPGGKAGSLVAMNNETGQTIWKTPGAAAGHASPVLWRPSKGRPQVVAFDEKTLGGYDLKSGQRLWTVTPKEPGDFNVPTPIALDDRILLATENNGARLLEVRDGVVNPTPQATYEKLAPDSHSPVLVGERWFGVHNGLHCVSANDLKPVWTAKDRVFQGKYASLIATAERGLVVNFRGELILFDATADRYVELGRLPLTSDKRIQCWSHPALANKRLYMRLDDKLVCLPLE